MKRGSRRPSEATPPRMQPLAKLPVFIELRGRRVVVAGGSDATAWKAELLASTEANVDVFAETLSPEMAALFARADIAGRLNHHARGWLPKDLEGAAFALADATNDADAEAFYRAATKAGVPVNVIDRPAFCQFHFGSIVNRSPVVIGISTDGAAPILGQAIRRRIETLLPHALARWAALAKAVRAEVSRRLAPGPQRRAFWERFADRAFGAPPRPDEGIDKLLTDVAQGVAETGGRVTLVGAGPGDPELLTLKAVRAMQSADVILFDDLVSDEVLELARREAKRMMVGKRGGRESCRQEDINALMVKLAGQGKHVVRLKCGDPTVFGRGGEEIATLKAAGIPVSVVAGITAASAMAAELGVSLTHRDHAHSVRFVTGHSRAGVLPEDLDWAGIADPDTSLIFYMGGRTAPAIAQRLRDEGLPETTPVVIQAAVSRPESTCAATTLGGLETSKDLLASGQPVLIGVGQVFAEARMAAEQPQTIANDDICYPIAQAAQSP